RLAGDRVIAGGGGLHDGTMAVAAHRRVCLSGGSRFGDGPGIVFQGHAWPPRISDDPVASSFRADWLVRNADHDAVLVDRHDGGAAWRGAGIVVGRSERWRLPTI